MKKLITAALLVVLVVVARAQTSNVVYSPNVAGFINVNVPGSNTFTMVAVPFTPSNTNGYYTLDDVLGGTNNFTANWSLTVADNVYVWNNYAQKYEQAFLNDDTWGLTDANWKWCYMGADNNPHPCAQTNIFNVTPSTGFYIVNRHGPVNLYLTGEVPTGTNTVGLAGLHMIAYPFPVSQPLATLLSTNDGAKANWSLTVADNIYLWNATSRKYDLFFYNDDTWGLTDANWKWCYMGTDNNPHAATNTIQPGMGFFYKVNGTNFNWNVACPYSF